MRNQAFARSASESAYPELWRNLHIACSTSINPRAGSTLYDIGATRNHLAFNNMDPASDWVVSNGLPGIDIDGTDDFLQINRPFRVTDSPGFSIAMWAVPRAVDSAWHAFSSKINSAGNNRQWFIGVNGGFGPPTNGISFFTNQSGVGGVGTNAITANRLYLIFCTHESDNGGTNSRNYMHVQSREGGVEVISAPNPNSNIDADDGTNPIRIGRYTDSNIFPLNGIVHDFLLWTVAKPLSLGKLLYELGPGGWASPRAKRLYTPFAAAPVTRANFLTLLGVS